MKKEIIFTEKATPPTGWYSQAVKVGDVVYLAGICGDDPKTSKIVSGGMKAETQMCLENMKAVIEAAGGTLESIVKISVFIKDINLLNDFNEVYKTFFPQKPPARISMQVSDLAGGANLEIDGVAVLQS